MKDIQCCPEGGEKNLSGEFQLQGNTFNIDDMRVYTVGEDIFGFEGGRTRQVCDILSKNDLKVYMPDVTRGGWFDPYNPKNSQNDLKNWVQKYPLLSIQNDIDNLIVKIENENQITSLGIAGFCWGAMAVFQACQNQRFQYGISYHPSLRMLPFFNIDPIEYSKNIISPQQLFISKQEESYYRKNGEIYNILDRKFKNDFEMHEFDVNHGYASRGDLNIKQNKIAFDQTIQLTYKFINRILKLKKQLI